MLNYSTFDFYFITKIHFKLGNESSKCLGKFHQWIYVHGIGKNLFPSSDEIY